MRLFIKKLHFIIAMLLTIVCCMALFAACNHEHTFAEEWSYDDTNHWHEATCRHTEEKSALSTHNFVEDVDTDDGTKFICKECGYFEIKPSRYRVTAEEYASIIGAVEKFRVDMVDGDGKHTYSIISDVVLLVGDDVTLYYGFEGTDLVCLVKNYEQEEYIEKEKDKDEYDRVKGNNNLLGYIADKFALLTYNLETKTYDAENLLIMEQGKNWLKFNDVSVSFEDGKLVSVKFVYASNSWTYSETGYTYSEIGTASAQLPETWHKHTYSEGWAINEYSHWHEQTCGHEYCNVYLDHTFDNSGVCTVCGYCVLELSEDGTTVTKLTNSNAPFVFPEGVTAIGEEAFKGTELTEIVISEGIKTIGKRAFEDCYKLTRVVIPKSVTFIDDYAFSGCSQLTEVVFCEGTESLSVGIYVFAFCAQLKTVTLPSTLTKISYFMFYICSELTTVNISEGVTEIGNMPFNYCESLTEIVIPKSVTALNRSAFSGSSITKIYYKGNATEWDNLYKTNNIRLGDGTSVYFYSETDPDETGKFWHYVDGMPVQW